MDDPPLAAQFDFVVDSANTYGFDSAYPAGVSQSLLTSITLSAAATVSDSGSIDLDEDICLGAVGCDAATNNYIFLSLSGSGGSLLGSCAIVGQVSGATCASGATVTFTNAVTTVSIAPKFVLSPPASGSAPTTLDSCKDTFGEDGIAPEPSTFVVLGSALAGLATLRLCQRSGKHDL